MSKGLRDQHLPRRLAKVAEGRAKFFLQISHSTFNRPPLRGERFTPFFSGSASQKKKRKIELSGLKINLLL
jgi:hypothetical protein